MTPGRPDTRTHDTLAALLTVAEEGLLAIDAGGTVVSANPAAASLLGLDGDLVGSPHTALQVKALVDRVSGVLAHTSRGGRIEFEIGERSLSCHLSHARTAGHFLLVSIRDETALAEERDRSEAILAATADGLVLLSPEDVVTYINPAASRMLATTPRKLVGKRVSIDALLGVEPSESSVPQKRCSEVKNCGMQDCPAYKSEDLRCWLISGTLCHPADEPCSFAAKREECQECEYHQAMAEAFDPLDSDSASEVELENREGHLVAEVRVYPVIDASGAFIGRVLALHDVTAEREIGDMKNEFVSTVSHELRTPLTSIKGYVDLILDGDAGEINEIQREFLGIVKENSDRLVELINEMLDISRIESGRVHLRIEPLNMADSISGAVDTFRAVLAQTDRTITAHIPHGLPPVAADRDRVGQVLVNLISNALKYSPGGGDIEVAARHENDCVSVSVTDHGLGISREDQKRLFTKFYRVDTAMTREIGGTGLGLSICKSIIELLGGEITVKSKMGAGSTFSFSLPVAAEQLVRTPTLEGPDDIGGKVLVVDRSPHVAGLIETYLVKRGYTVVKAHTADDALEIALREKPRVITLDVIMEGADGFNLLQRLKETPATSDIPVVVLSIVCDEGRSCRLGAANYLEKPIDQHRLLSMIDDIVGSVDSPVALVVDDEPDVVSMMSKTLRKKGFAVAGAFDGVEAIASIEQRIPDIIIADLKMPRMDGYELIQRVKTVPKWADIPIVVMTGHRIDRSRIDVLDLAVTSLQKPFSPQDIADEVSALLERKGLGVTT